MNGIEAGRRAGATASLVLLSNLVNAFIFKVELFPTPTSLRGVRGNSFDTFLFIALFNYDFNF